MAKRRVKRVSKPQPEQNVLLYEPSGTTSYIDLAAALSGMNRKQYHQTKNYKPLLYHWRAQAIDVDSSTIQFATAPNTWTTRNAVVKLGAMYKKQLRDNSLSRSMLPKFGKELRLAIATSAGYSHGAGADGFGQVASYSGLMPRTGVVGDSGEIFADYTNSDGSSVTDANANELSTISIPEATADGEPEVVVISLTGTSVHDDNDLALIPEYLASRRNMHDHDEKDSNIPSDDNLLMRIGAAANEHFDDVVEAIEDVGDRRPYNEAGANALVMQGALMAAGDYCSGVAPLGLIKVASTANAEFLLTVTAITEM